ncbi:MAG: hypothetical protein H7X80_05280 [bacterium]|nr:hypothetical protein [Candidatus Kapabacteria bacterium]
MINDIFATSMQGRFIVRNSGDVVEQGEWTYRGFGNAEIAMTAVAERVDGGLNYELRIHSVERQLDDIQFRSQSGGVPTRAFNAKIAGHTMTLATPDEHGGEEIGNLALPPETIFDGPSPIWFIHLALTAPPPTDRVVTTPIIRFNISTGDFDGGFYRLKSDGKDVSVSALDTDGVETGTLAFTISDDGFVSQIRVGESEIEVQRLPSATYHS